jgi:diguanylate cyclase (GGDEF)-like protein
MFPPPDVSTLRLCSMLAGVAFALVFVGLWLRRRDDNYLLYWAAGSVGYSAVLLGLQEVPTPIPTVVGIILYVLLAATSVILLVGVRAFDGAPPLRWWMALPLVASGLGYAVPALAAVAGLGQLSPVVGKICGMLGLASACGLTGAMLLAGGIDGGGRGRRIAGAAILAYIPVYLISIAGEFDGGLYFNLSGMMAMLSDQVLLPILNLGLLAMPGERAEQTLRDLAHRDPLTGAWNRAGLQANEQRLARPGNAVILVDIDHFKQINDQGGHGAGDAVLRTLAGRMAQIAARRDGRVARLGGDEFILIVPAGPDEAAFIAEQVRAAAAHGERGLSKCTVSLGVAQVNEEDPDLAQAIARADRSLYLAKGAGRNRVAA